MRWLLALAVFLVVTSAAAPTQRAMRTIVHLHLWQSAPPDGAVVFLGDSLVQGLAGSDFKVKTVNLAIPGLTANRVASLVQEHPHLAQAKAVFVSIGLNDLLNGRNPTKGLTDIANAMPDVPVLWHAIVRSPLVDQERTDAANATAQRLCASMPQCRYIETAMPTGSHLQDQIHLSAIGYRAWSNSIHAALTKSERLQ
jgi:lysophospholipase L1-like esterase